MQRRKPLLRRRSLKQARAKRTESFGRELRETLERLPGGLVFRERARIGPFVADFVCPAAKLAIFAGEEDETRSRWFSSQGWRVLTFTEAECSDAAFVRGAIARLFELRLVRPAE
ncbi:MAG TPA: DUF559 domain-containing protein [Rhizomicrobium sp.]|nr:DUF559 domain-containing protein [Rhizomicrobium sp.]